MKCRAATLIRPGKVELVEFDMPKQTEDMLCAVSASGVCGTDFHIITGKLNVSLPMVLGHENVISVDKNISGIKCQDGKLLEPGDRAVLGVDVTCGTCWYCNNLSPDQLQLCDNCETYGITMKGLSGGWSEKILVRKGSYVVRAPDSLSDEELVLTDSMASTWNLRRICSLGVTKIESVVIVGSGVIGILSALRCRLLGIKNIIVVGGPDFRLKKAGQFSDTLISTKDTDSDERKRVIEEATGGRGADLVVDAAGTPSAFSDSLNFVRKGGVVSEIGAFGDLGEACIKPSDFVFKDITIIGQYGYPPHEYRFSLDLLKRAVENYDIRRLVTHKIGLDEIPGLLDRKFVKDKEYIKIMVKP